MTSKELEAEYERLKRFEKDVAILIRRTVLTNHGKWAFEELGQKVVEHYLYHLSAEGEAK